MRNARQPLRPFEDPESENEIWDAHVHLSGVPGATPELRAAALLAAADRVGVRKLCLSMGLTWARNPEPDDLRRQNDEVLRALDHWRDRLLGFVYVSPEHPEASLLEIERHVARGPMVGLKLWVAAPCSDPRIEPIVARAAELQAPILQHTWIKTDGSQLPGESRPEQLAELALRFPRAVFLCGHLGGSWELGVRAIRRAPNVLADIAGNDPASGIVEMAVRELGPERVVYGSDAGGRAFASQLAKVLAARVDEPTKRLVLGGNLRRILAPILRDKAARTPVAPPTPTPTPTPRPNDPLLEFRTRFAALRPVDVNVSLGEWPLRTLPAREPRELRDSLRERRVVEAWVAPVAGILHRDLRAVNADHARALASNPEPETETETETPAPRLVPVGVVNPQLPAWEDDLEECAAVHRMPGIRLHPAHHGYDLADPRFEALLDRAAALGLFVQIPLALEDERTQSPFLRAPHLDVAPLAPLLARRAERRAPVPPLILLNAFRSLRVPDAVPLARSGPVHFEIAMLEGVAAVAQLVRAVGHDRVLLGSHTPLFTGLAADLKLHEADLPPEVLRAVARENARRILPLPTP